MSASLPRQLACQSDPDRWFDPADKRHALELCLQCPARSWCAGQALRVHATYGMWGGIFIRDNFHQVADLLAAVAKLPASPQYSGPRPLRVPTPPGGQKTSPSTAARNNAVLAALTARSSGHCEIMTQHCRLTFDTLGSRIPDKDPWTSQRAGEIYAVCRPCAAAIAAAEPQFVRHMGIVVDPPYDPVFTKFLWRQKHWVYLSGQLLPIDDTNQRQTTG